MLYEGQGPQVAPTVLRNGPNGPVGATFTCASAGIIVDFRWEMAIPQALEIAVSDKGVGNKNWKGVPTK